jgi:hypothetical protein
MTILCEILSSYLSESEKVDISIYKLNNST